MNISETESINAANDPKSAGRWTNEEHILFLQGLQLYNKQWKMIADLVKTRTVVQIRTHAQKYFLKLQKSNQINDKTYAQLASIMRSDSIDSTVYNQDFGASTGATTSEGESDNERSLSITSDDKMPSITLPKLLLTKSDGDLKSKSESPRKRSRENKGTPKPKSSTAKSPKRSNARSVSASALNSLCAMSREVELLQEEDLGLSVEKFYEFLPYEDDGSTDCFDDNFFDRIEWNANSATANIDDDSDSFRSQSPFSRSISNSGSSAPPTFPNLNFEEIPGIAALHNDPAIVAPSSFSSSSFKDSSLLRGTGIYSNPSEDSYELPSYASSRPNLTLTIGNHSALQNNHNYHQKDNLMMDEQSSSGFVHPMSSGFTLNIFPPPSSPSKSPRKRGRPKKYNNNNNNLSDTGSVGMDVAESSNERGRSESMMSISDAPEITTSSTLNSFLPLNNASTTTTIGGSMQVPLPSSSVELPSIVDQFTSSMNHNKHHHLHNHTLPPAPLLTAELTRLSLPLHHTHPTHQTHSSDSTAMDATTTMSSNVTAADLLPSSVPSLPSSSSSDMLKGFDSSLRLNSMLNTEVRY